MAGITPLAPGYSRIQIAPCPGPGIDHVAASYDSIRGRIASEWQRQGDTLRFTATVPPNTTAEIRIPLVGQGALTLDGKPLADSGLTITTRQPDALKLEVGSGTYAFEVR
jgi:hypothetical protein